MTASDRELREREWREEEAAPFSGWDFSRLEGRLLLDPPPWSYEDMARELLSASASALDLGTGGGERLWALRDALPARTAATEGHPPNLELARKRLGPLGVAVVECGDSLDHELPFADGEFDLVVDRHTSFNAAEVARVLAPGGTFLTQQVDGRNLSDLSAAFDDEQPWTFFTLDFSLEKIRAAGLVVDLAREWTGRAAFRDVGAVVYYLKAVPWTVPRGFSVQTRLAELRALQERLEREGELSFEQRLFVLRAVKTGSPPRVRRIPVP